MATVFMALLIVYATPNHALASEGSNFTSNSPEKNLKELSVLKDNTDNSINPLADEMTRHFTFPGPKTYTTLAEVPEYQYFNHYSGGYWWSGFLKCTDTVWVQGSYKATYSGTLTSFGN